MKISILLTSTIKPINVPFTLRIDPYERESDYLRAFNFYLSLNKYPVVFFENSNWDIKKFRILAEKRSNLDVELLQVDCNYYSEKFGKGFGELQTIKYSLNNSNILKKSDLIIKISGRYIINNLARIVKKIKLIENLFISVDLTDFLRNSKSVIFCAKREFFEEYLTKYLEKINDRESFYFEHALSKATLEAIVDGKSWHPLPTPIINGISGTCNKKIKSSIFSGVKNEIKELLMRKYCSIYR